MIPSQYKMKSIDYNLMMTFISMLREKLPYIMSEYNINTDLSVEPSYPRDLAKLHKPSIIVRKVDVEQSKLAMGNFIGQIYDAADGYSDVSGVRHDIMLQFDVVTGGNIQMTTLASILTEDIINNIIVAQSGKFRLYDYTGDIKNPTESGMVTLDDFPTVINIPDGIERPNANNDYICAVRQTFTIVQTIVPKQDHIDLSKWIKQSFTIKAK